MVPDEAPAEPNELVPAAIVDAGYLRLPFDREQFKEFIRGLLGRPQSISRAISGPFEVEVSDVQDLNELLSQRIAQQNGGILASFSALVAFSDNSTVEVTSVPEMLSYNEVRPVVCNALHLKWDYLVRFQDKQVPEKQSIQVSYVASMGDESSFDAPNVIVINAHPHGHMVRPGYITLRIEHTARTWGADIEALLSGFFKARVKAEASTKKWIRAHHGSISLGLALGFFAITTIGLFLTTRRFGTSQMAAAQAALKGGAATDQVYQSLVYVAGQLAKGAWAQYEFAALVLLVVSVFLAIVIGAWADSAASTTEPSFILLNRESRNAKQRVLKKLERKWRSFALSVLISLVLGVVSNVIFAAFFA